MKLFLLVIIILFPSFALGGETSYLCEIKEIKELSKHGKMVDHKGSFKNLIGEKFTINRSNGEMKGLPFSTASYKTITVIDKGSKDNSYKALVTSHSPNTWVMYLYVAEHQNSPKKSFWGTDDGNKIFSGLCY
jgi:hypothetical protein